ncbi:glycoside hydrolase family 1 protein [Patescibacteria group bacterium]|nr:glycoside hydrolase family 1 protein [Patescibacteria group bacterium]
MVLKFPDNFLWGSATSAYQVEGGNKLSDWEINPPKRGHGPAGLACDHYNRFEPDFDLLKKLNQNAHRFSIEWAKIEPRQGEFDKIEIEHYRRVLSALKQRGIKTMVTLHHFTLPQWLAEIGGFANNKSIEYFTRYAAKLFGEYQDLIDFWATINEPMVFAGQGYLAKRWLPQKRNIFLYIRVVNNLIRAHQSVYRLFKTFGRDKVLVGIVKHNTYFEPSKNLLDRFIVGLPDWWQNRYFLNKIKNHCDFIGLNYYFHFKIKFPGLIRNENKKVSDMGWELYPEGIYYLLKELKRYNKPVYITENGLADAGDKNREWYIREVLRNVHWATQEGIDVRGYFYWSLMDNFEWADGFGPRFGLIEIDYSTLERKPRPSAYFYSEICKNNQLFVEG